MTSSAAVLYTRVSSREQVQEGFSLDAQSKLLRDYAERQGFQIVQAFEDVETAKTTGRKQFGAMVTFLRRNRSCRVLIVEKTDRLYRNFRDSLTLEDLDINIHFVKEGEVLSKDSKSYAKFIHDLRVAMARNYSGNLSEEVVKGMREKAAQGTYPGRAPFGYRNLRETRTIEVHPRHAPITQHAFELYASGRFSLKSLSNEIQRTHGTVISKTNLEKMLKNPFYIGTFRFKGSVYRGKHAPIVSVDLFETVQSVLGGHNRPKYRKLHIPFRGILSCARCGCTVTGELKKGKYVYYRCSGGRGPCDLPRFTEREIAEKLGALLKNISIPEPVVRTIAESLERVHVGMRKKAVDEREGLKRQLAKVQQTMDAAYEDKLVGNIPVEFWNRKQTDWLTEERRLKERIEEGGSGGTDEGLRDARRILELAQKAHSLYLARKPAGQADLLKMVLWNCKTDGLSLYPAYRKPFDLICQRVKTNEWSGREDSNLRPPGPEPVSATY
jgi:site-specific DNA recombinase